MNLSNYFWYSQSAIPHRICDLILKQGKKSKAGLAITGQQQNTDGKGGVRNIKEQPLNQQEMKTLKKKRDSQIVWMNESWIYREIHPYVRRANQESGWNFEWEASEAAQFTIYKKDMHYNWHTDSFPKPYEQGTSKGMIRKLTTVVVLSDPHEYEGGSLEFQFNAEDPQYNKKRIVTVAKEVAPKGSIIVFPSFVWHRVKPVTKGVRYSMPTWHLGAPFK